MPIVRLPEGDLRDEIRNPLYDTVDLTGALSGTTYNFFSSVLNKTLAQTNLKQNGQLETAVSFRVQGLALDAQNVVSTESFVLPIILERSSIRLHIGEKDYWSGPARFAAGRVQQNAAFDASAAPTYALLQQYGWAAVQGVMFSAKHVVDINPLQSFFMQWIIDTIDATNAARATVTVGEVLKAVGSLKGLLRRPVQ